MMPHTTEESDKGHRTGSTTSIAMWWNKFHFSGRVIMCSVLFGLGLVLVGSLVFAINMDDTTRSNENEASELLPTKPPSKYVGPVIMGIGGLIVTVGVIMCLFETQVCRKKSGDASPLISDKADPEEKVSDSLPVPTSHCHKNHKHGKHSPRKSKGKHGKSHSKDKSQSKSPSPRSPPVSIDQSKNFMTSSEDKFLTPPNIPNTLEQNKSDTIPNSDTSSLMKSFTSSGPSWNQSAEFLTPSASFKDASLSLNSSIEVNGNQEQVNFKTSEFMTPLTVEEERIQKLLIRVKNEQKEVANKEMEEKNLNINDGAKSEIITDSQNGQAEIIKEDDTFIDNAENKSFPTDVLPAPRLSSVSEPESAKINSCDELSENKNNSNQNIMDNNITINADHIENSEIQKEISLVNNLSMQDSENLEVSSVSSAPLTHINKTKFDTDHHFNKKSTNEENVENDLENSVSSDDTVVSPDSFLAKSKGSVQSILKENSHTSSHSKAESDLESLNSAKTAEDNSKGDPVNGPSHVSERAEMQPNEITRKESNSNKDNHIEKAQPEDDLANNI